MALNLDNFNRIIDLEFSTGAGSHDANGHEMSKMTKSIVCPRHGIKPQIEINGTYGTAKVLEAFHITIKNLYVDLRTEPYSKIKVRAGYANNWVQFEADIFNMYQESPGPEGTWVIECKTGQQTETWLTSTVSVKYDSGTKLTTILDEINSKLNGSGVTMGETAKTLTLKTPMQYNGSARGLLSNIDDRFSDHNLRTFMRGSKLCAICLAEGDFINTRVLEYMSAPPQQNPGDQDGNWHTMITAPWMPDLLPGDQLIVPSNVYVNSGSLVGGAKKTQKLQVNTMSFHFGTRGSVNQMTCDGFIVR